MVYKSIFAFVLMLGGFSSFSSEKPTNINEQRCYEQLSLGLVPEACYVLSHSNKETAFLDMKCLQTAKAAASIEVILVALKSHHISQTCFDSLKARAEILNYKISDKGGHRAFRYSRILTGLNFDKATRHADKRFQQSN